MARPEFAAGDIGEALRQSFHITNDDFIAKAAAEGKGDESGTTAVAVLIRGDTMYVANTGDSRASICSGGVGEAKWLGWKDAAAPACSGFCHPIGAQPQAAAPPL